MSVHKVLSNTELLSLILDLSGVSTCARLASTSNRFFRAGAILVWKNLTTAKPLILLIPGAQEVEVKTNEYTIRLPPPPADFSRFDVYAPFVHSLAIFGPDSPGFSIDSSWQTLIFRGRDSVLLPNLKSFALDHHFKEDEEPILWVSAFVSPSLRDFRATKVQRETSSVTSSTMSIILRRVAYGCSKLESLTLFVGSLNSAQNNNRLLRVILEEPLSRTWQNFQSLSSLVTDVNTLDADSLSSLGQLPHLKFLDIHGTVLNHPRDLTIRKLHYDDILAIWNLEYLVEGVTCLTLLVRPWGIGASAAVQLSSEFLPVLSARTPQLTHLNILFMSHSPGNNTMLVDIKHFKCLATLPLSWVVIKSICLYDPRTKKDEKSSFAKEIAALWPNVAVLKLPDQEMTTRSLHYFAALSNLRYLLLNIRWDKGWSSQGIIQPVPGNLPLDILEFSRTMTRDFALGKVEELAKGDSSLGVSKCSEDGEAHYERGKITPATQTIPGDTLIIPPEWWHAIRGGRISGIF
ncbi:hypothetical protein BDV93DRAFT_507695 [Ceratobasidium sp. AG-I]|nr:hypothetical protein BDV93DRAFT_507695 [Ceratobasidium sp. AG-I]